MKSLNLLKLFSAFHMFGYTHPTNAPGMGTAKFKSNDRWQKHYTPPRSMTEEEKAYYAEHKNLANFH